MAILNQANTGFKLCVAVLALSISTTAHATRNSSEKVDDNGDIVVTGPKSIKKS